MAEQPAQKSEFQIGDAVMISLLDAEKRPKDARAADVLTYAGQTGVGRAFESSGEESVYSVEMDGGKVIRLSEGCLSLVQPRSI